MPPFDTTTIARATKNDTEIYNEILQKANTYSSFRNSLAHNITIIRATEAGAKMALVEGKKAHTNTVSEDIDVDDLSNAGDNFRSLANLTEILRRLIRMDYLERISEFLEQLRMLPNDPCSLQASQNQVGLQRQRQAALRSASKTPDSE